ncbi:DsbA family protein [Candidatus Falkowbacteria bacterium]|nr:DsbA family protein [Candidatus Falkowbacteria bacterium]
MFKKNRGNQSFIYLFIAASFVAVLLFFFLSMFLRGYMISSIEKNRSSATDLPQAKLDTDDPFITRSSNTPERTGKPKLKETDPVLGSKEAPITIFQFSDLTCKYCANQENIIRKLIIDYPGKIKLVWKDYPEKASTSPSQLAAVAARCASEQGRFWEYHDLVSASAKTIDQNLLTSLAKNLKLNLIAFNSCVKGQAAKQLVQDGLEEADGLQITGIPYLFVNDKEFMGETSADELKQTIDNLLK